MISAKNMASSTQMIPTPPITGPVLAQPDRERLAGIVQKMQQNGESDENIRTAVGAFKQKYGKDQNPMTTPPTAGPSPETVQKVMNTGLPATPDKEVSKNPASKPFASLESVGNSYIGTSKMLDQANQGTSPQQQAMSFAPVPASMPAYQNQTVQLQNSLPQLKQQSQDLHNQLQQEEVGAEGTLKDITTAAVGKQKDFFEGDQLNYGKLHDYALEQARANGGDRYVGEMLYNRMASALQYQHYKPEADAEFKKQTGVAPDQYLSVANPDAAGKVKDLQLQFQHNYEAESRRSQDLINQKASAIFTTKYKPELDQLAQQFGADSPQVQQRTAQVKAEIGDDLRSFQTSENARLVRMREQLGRQYSTQLQGLEKRVSPVELAQFNEAYNKAYQSVVQRHDAAKAVTAGAGLDMAGLFVKSLWSGVNSWAATRGAGLVAAGINNPVTDWMRGRQTAAEGSDVPDAPLSGANLLNPATYATRAGKMVGAMAPDLALTALTKNPTFGGLEFTASSTLSGMGDVYNQAKAEGLDEAAAQQKAQDFAKTNFALTLPGNFLMSSAILSNLKGVGGFLANTGKEITGGLGTALPQQYLTQAAGPNAKTLGQFMAEDAPKAALENVIALAAGAPVMRAIGALTHAGVDAKAQSTASQFYSDIIDKHGVPAAYANAEMLYLNGVIDKPGLANVKGMIDKIASGKSGLNELGAGPDQHKLYLDTKEDIDRLKGQAAATTDETLKGMLEQKIKDKEKFAQLAVDGKAPMVTFSGGTNVVVPVDKAMTMLDDPKVQEGIRSGDINVETHGEDKDVADVMTKMKGIMPNPLEPHTIDVRHAVTPEDDNGVTSGPTDVALNDRGRQMAQQLGEDLETRGITRVVSSTLPRGTETAGIVADHLGVPHETRSGLDSWDIGDFDKTKDTDFKAAEKYFVQNPDAVDFEGKRLGESFNQYKDRVLAERQSIEDERQKGTLVVNHGGNINLWDAVQKNGEWNEKAASDYLNAPDMPPATLRDMQGEPVKGNTPEENEALDAHGVQAAHEVVDQIKNMPGEDLAKMVADYEQSSKTGPASGNREAGDQGPEHIRPVHQGDEAEAGTGEAIAKNGPLSPGDGDAGTVRAPGSPEGNEPVSDEKRATEPLKTTDDFHAELAKLFAQDKISKGVEVGGKKNSLDQYVSKGKAVLGQLFPDHTIKTYDTEDEYRRAEGRPAGSAGVYDRNGKYIALNLERIRAAGAENTVFHEVIHPIVQEALESQPGAVDTAYSKLVDLKDTPGMAGVWQHEEQYRARGLDVMKVEAITEFLTHVADGRIDPDKFETSIKTKIIDAINKVFKALGIDKVISTAQDIKRLADTIKQAFDKADATPVEKALGRRIDADGKDKMDAIVGTEDHAVRKLIQRAPDSMTDDDISNAIQKASGWDKTRADKAVADVRDEQSKSALELIRDAKAKGAALTAAAKQAPKTPGPLMKKMGRFFMDLRDDVSDVKSIIRRNKGNEDYELTRIYKQSEKLAYYWNKIPQEQQEAFILGIERPDLRKGWTQEMKNMADGYKSRLDEVYNVIKKALPTINFLEDYFPHFWEKPDEVKNYFASTIGKTPMEGSKSFAKERIFSDIRDGLEKGYKLITSNPEELVRLAEANAWKFSTARSMFDDMQKAGYLKYSTTKGLPSDWQTVNDPMFKKIGAYVDKLGDAQLSQGSYMMPPDVAKLVNTYLSPGIKGPVADVVRNWNNIKNAFQLGVGFFHYGTTTIEANTSALSKGLQLLTTGKPGNIVKGVSNIVQWASVVGSPAGDLARGWRAMEAYNKGWKISDVQSLIDANGRVGKQKFYSLDAKYNMMKAFGKLRADGDFSQLGKVGWNALLYIPESMNKFLVEKWVPGLKVGGYLRSLDAEIAARPSMTPDELQRAKERIWDAQDDRLGQVVYDNRFMNKVVKDLGFLSIRSLGWTGGTISAVAHGVGDIPHSAIQAVGKGEGITQRTAWAAALPMTVGLYGAYFMAMHTGKWPSTMEDYFFPKDGSKNPDGTDHRIALPTYMKDILAYSKSPVETLMHKTAPMLNDLVELYNNKDFYGEQIYNRDDPFYRQGFDVLKHQLEGMEPFSFRQRPGEDKTMAQQFTTREGLEQKFGIMPAPKERERTDLQNKIMQASADQGNDKAMTHTEMQEMIAKRHVRQFLHDGGSYADVSDELKKEAKIKPQEIGKFIRESKIDPYERVFKYLKPEAKLKLFNQMSDADKEKYGKYVSAALRAQPEDQ